jgi:hypothetical protein
MFYKYFMQFAEGAPILRANAEGRWFAFELSIWEDEG